MSYEETLKTLSAPANADLSAGQYKAVVINSSGKVALAGAGAFCAGILQDKPAAADRACTVAYGGISKALAGGSITAGATVAANASGALVDASEAVTNTGDAGGATDALIGSNVVGIAMAGADSGDIFPVLITLSGAVPTTAA